MEWALLQLLDIAAGRAAPSDLIQDQIGARSLLAGTDPYPILGPAIRMLGQRWDITGISTHPPTAFLFLLPIAALGWPLVALLWTSFVILLLAASAWLSSMPTWALPALLLWPPALTGIGQLPAIWLVGSLLAWRWRERPLLAGMAIGVASLTKLTPAVLLLPHIRRREWGALAGFGAVWVAALGTVVLLDPGAVGRYLAVNRGATGAVIARADNGALVPYLAHQYGHAGALLGMALLACAAVAAGRRAYAPDRGWPLCCWLAVAVLPIAWTYSLLSLLPCLLVAARIGRPYQRIAALAAFVVPFWGVIPSSNAEAVALTIALAGVASSGPSLGTTIEDDR